VKLFVQPHSDDIALSCGGTVATTASGERTVIATVFCRVPDAGVPRHELARSIEGNWQLGDGAQAGRRAEDEEAARGLGAELVWLDHLDAIFRGSAYADRVHLRGPVRDADRPAVAAAERDVIDLVTRLGPTVVFLPLAVGGHVDHRACHEMHGALAAAGAEIWLYEDQPYSLVPDAIEARLAELGPLQFEPRLIDVSSVWERRIAAALAYRSQLPVMQRRFYPDLLDRLRAHASRLAEGSGLAERFWCVGRER
jgi:LmbE family N-acetylglucosaminyl deacetylase